VDIYDAVVVFTLFSANLEMAHRGLMHNSHTVCGGLTPCSFVPALQDEVATSNMNTMAVFRDSVANTIC